MCYIGCVHERFNPVTGVCKCVDLSGGPCPHESNDECIMCHSCEEEFEDEDQDERPNCGAIILR